MSFMKHSETKPDNEWQFKNLKYTDNTIHEIDELPIGMCVCRENTKQYAQPSMVANFLLVSRIYLGVIPKERTGIILAPRLGADLWPGILWWIQVCHSKMHWTSMAPGNDCHRDSATWNNQQYDEGVGNLQTWSRFAGLVVASWAIWLMDSPFTVEHDDSGCVGFIWWISGLVILLCS
jgi:hypothetical protein